MKKIIVSLLAVGLLLVGCGKSNSSSKSTTTSCSVEEAGMKISLKVTEQDNKINGLAAVYELDLGQELDEDDKAMFEKTIKEQYEQYKGLSFDMEYEGTNLEMIMGFDLDKLDSLPAEFGGITGKDIKQQNPETFVEELSEVGFSCSVE